MRLNTRLTGKLGIAHPILLAPMNVMAGLNPVNALPLGTLSHEIRPEGFSIASRFTNLACPIYSSSLAALEPSFSRFRKIVQTGM